MFNNKTIRVYQNYLHVVVIGLFVLAITMMTATQSVSVQAQTINKVNCTNVRDTSFDISWTTNSATDANVDWDLVTPPVANTSTDPVGSSFTHYVTVLGLSPTTPYWYQVRSGATLDNNVGAFYNCTTGPTLGVPAPGLIVWGFVYQSDGSTPVPNATVYLQIQDGDGSGSPGSSQWVNARTDPTGVWSFALGNVRTADLSAYYSFGLGTGDVIRIITQGGQFGVIGETGAERFELIPATLATVPAQFDTTLDGSPTNITLVNFSSEQSNPGLSSAILPLLILILLAMTLIRRKRKTAME